MRKPNFFCIGAQKCGTTSLFNLLVEHEDIFLPSVKEDHFFDVDERFNKGLDWYLNQYFKDANNEKIVGSITPDYLFFNKCPKRIFNLLGRDIKLIIILRNPVDRAYSHYLMSKRRGYEEFDFLEAIKHENKRMSEGNHLTIERNSYISRSMYYEQIKRYENIFCKENLLILSYQDLFFKETEKSVNRITQFLDIKPIINPNFKTANQSSKPRSTFLMNIIFKDNFMKSFIKNFIPNASYRAFLKQKAERALTVPTDNKGLASDVKDKLFNKYFYEDYLNILENYSVDIKE